MLSEKDINQLRRLMELRDKRDEAKTTLANAEKDFREAEADLHEVLYEGPMVRLPNVDLGEPWGKVSFHAKETIYGRVIDEEEASKHYDQREMTDEMVAMKFSDKRLNEEVRAALEENRPPPPGTDHYARRYVQITRSKT